MSACRALRRLTSRRRATALVIGAAVAALTLSSCSLNGTSGGSADTKFIEGKSGVDTVPAKDRKPAPDLSGKTVDGKQLNLAAYKGKVVVINVWGSWCPPCIAEIPGFVKVANETKSKGVQFVGINTRDPSPANASGFEKAHHVPYPSLYDPVGKLMLRFPKGSLNPQAIPSTIALDRQGRIAARALAPLSEQELRQMIDPLIAEK
jgi:thiol-disulfide isomerase/thioredoxin